MRRNLSKLEATLDGFAPRKPEYFRPIREIELNEFYDAKVVGLDKDKDGKPIIKLDLGLPKGVVPYQSLFDLQSSLMSQQQGVRKSGYQSSCKPSNQVKSFTSKQESITVRHTRDF